MKQLAAEIFWVMLLCPSNIREAKKQQEEIYGMTDIDFYVPPLRDLWGTGRNMACLLAWNPDNWPWENLTADRAATHEGKTVTLRYTCANRNADVGDKAYLLRTAVDPKGIVATGNIVTAPYEDAHYNEQKAAKGETAWYVEVAFTRIQDPLTGDSYLTRKDLNKITIEQQNWSPQSSGIEIKPRTAGILKKHWENVVESGIKKCAFRF